MKKQASGVLVVCSGGLDSTVALVNALRERGAGRVEALTFTYGQNHAKRENAAVKRICRTLKVPLTRVELPFMRSEFKSALLGGRVPDGYYTEKSMESTVVPFRNGIMLSIAAGIAESRGLSRLVIGNHAGDHFIYPDCRPDFIKSMAAAIYEGTGRKIHLESPFCMMTKADIVKLGKRINAPLALTYSCYKGGVKHCGTCGTCTERKEAFKEARVKDPTEYRA